VRLGIKQRLREVQAKDRIPVPQRVTWRLVKGKCLSQLLSRSLRGRMTDHVEVENATTIMGQYQKHFRSFERPLAAAMFSTPHLKGRLQIS
jgi:hypothetical protein